MANFNDPHVQCIVESLPERVSRHPALKMTRFYEETKVC